MYKKMLEDKIFTEEFLGEVVYSYNKWSKINMGCFRKKKLSYFSKWVLRRNEKVKTFTS